MGRIDTQRSEAWRRRGRNVPDESRWGEQQPVSSLWEKHQCSNKSWRGRERSWICQFFRCRGIKSELRPAQDEGPRCSYDKHRKHRATTIVRVILRPRPRLCLRLLRCWRLRSENVCAFVDEHGSTTLNEFSTSATSKRSLHSNANVNATTSRRQES